MDRVRAYPVTPPTIQRVPMTNAGTADYKLWAGVKGSTIKRQDKSPVEDVKDTATHHCFIENLCKRCWTDKSDLEARW